MQWLEIQINKMEWTVYLSIELDHGLFYLNSACVDGSYCRRIEISMEDCFLLFLLIRKLVKTNSLVDFCLSTCWLKIARQCLILWFWFARQSFISGLQDGLSYECWVSRQLRTFPARSCRGRATVTCISEQNSNRGRPRKHFGARFRLACDQWRDKIFSQVLVRWCGGSRSWWTLDWGQERKWWKPKYLTGEAHVLQL